MSLVWDDVTYPTTWIINITHEARNDMQVQVRNGLTSGRSNVDSDVKAIGAMVLLDSTFRDVDACQELGLFSLRGFEPRIHMPLR